jgi:hypothetical protein
MNNIDALIHAYQEELRGYQRRGLTDRAKLVEEELRRLGHSPGVTPREDVLTEPTSTHTITPEAPQKPAKAAKDAPAPKRPTTRKKR